jgi:hypothetical protein
MATPNMRDAGLESLRLELLRGGVNPLYVDRTIVELGEHYADLESAALAAGQTPADAARGAAAALGNQGELAAAILARRELLTFRTRWPRVAHCLHSVAAIGALPGLPLLYCIEHRPELARWSAAVGVAAALMGSVLAALNWLIVVPTF